MQYHPLRIRLLLGYALLISLFAIAIVTMPTHGATWPSIAFDSYQAADGTFTPLSCGTTSGTLCPPIPVGSTLKIVVFVGLDNCDPVTLAYGDGTSDQVNLGGSAGHDFYHKYNSAGDYKLTASFNACSGGQPSAQAAITIGGGANAPDVFAYATSLSVPAATGAGLIFGLASVGLALAPPSKVTLYRPEQQGTSFSGWVNPVNGLPIRMSVPLLRDNGKFGDYRYNKEKKKAYGHEGIDILVAEGKDVCAALDGKVRIASEDNATHNGGYGGVIYISHSNGVETRYAHLSKILVKPGQNVRAGEIIGKSGTTGNAQGEEPHLHFEILEKNTPVDPLRYLSDGSGAPN